jgi:hypothetical protein
MIWKWNKLSGGKANRVAMFLHILHEKLSSLYRRHTVTMPLPLPRKSLVASLGIKKCQSLAG